MKLSADHERVLSVVARILGPTSADDVREALENEPPWFDGERRCFDRGKGTEPIEIGALLEFDHKGRKFKVTIDRHEWSHKLGVMAASGTVREVTP